MENDTNNTENTSSDIESSEEIANSQMNYGLLLIAIFVLITVLTLGFFYI